jgi:hypothetical protein
VGLAARVRLADVPRQYSCASAAYLRELRYELRLRALDRTIEIERPDRPVNLVNGTGKLIS